MVKKADPIPDSTVSADPKRDQSQGHGPKPQLSAEVVVFCDESGAKGYAGQVEKEPGEIGLFSGFPVPRLMLELLAAELKSELAPFRKKAGKIHITDLPPEEQQALREKVYTIFVRREVFCFYEAIYVAGFNDAYKRDCQVIETMAAKLGRRRKKMPVPQSLHVHLFLGFYGRILTFCAKQGITDLKVEIRTDRIDAPILKKFHSEAVKLLSDTRTFEIKHWDIETSTVKKQTATLRLQGWPAPLSVQDCVIKPDKEDSDLVLAADVIANSVNRHFGSRPAGDKFNSLNSRDAVLTHPLAGLLNIHPPAWDFSDAFFGHPLSPRRSKSIR
jgi:hypothetical protein